MLRYILPNTSERVKERGRERGTKGGRGGRTRMKVWKRRSRRRRRRRNREGEEEKKRGKRKYGSVAYTHGPPQPPWDGYTQTHTHTHTHTNAYRRMTPLSLLGMRVERDSNKAHGDGQHQKHLHTCECEYVKRRG
jgi:hypothetical protein